MPAAGRVAAGEAPGRGARATVRRLWEQGVQGIGALCDASALSVPAVWGVLRGMGVEDMPWWDEGEQWPDATEAA